jgi:hypothetical protein
MLQRIAALSALFVSSVLTTAQTVDPPIQTPQNPTHQAGAPARHPADGHLTRVQTLTTSEVTNAFRPPMICDPDGNVYLSTDPVGVSGIRKLNEKGERIALFETSANHDLKVDAVAYFSLQPGGDLYELVYPHEINRYVFISKPDGTFKSAIKLDPGFPFLPKKLAVFSGGQFLVAGEKYDADKTGALRPFAGIFAADGHLLKEFELEDDKALHDIAASGGPRVALSGMPHANHAVDNSQVAMGDDGNAYLMRWTNPATFYAISPGGEAVRRFTVDPGASGFMPAEMDLYENRIAILFVARQTFDLIIKIVDLEGHEIATYDRPRANGKPKDDLGVALACYTENPTRFIFLGANDDDKLQLRIVELR